MTDAAFGSGAEERERFTEPVLALDLGGTHLRTAVALPDGSLAGRRMTRTPPVDADALVRACADQLRETLHAARRERTGRSGIEPALLAISAPGPLNPWTGTVIDPPNMDRSLWGYPLAQRLSETLGLPAALERDTQVAALAEGAFGAARGLRDYVYLTVSTGVGGAAVVDGRLLRGPDGVAGELGHLVVDLDGPPCGCGARGHLEALTSGTGIAAQARRAIEAGEVGAATPLGRLAAQRGAAALGGIDVAAAEDEGDPVAAHIMERARLGFAAALVSIVDVFNPERVIVGGGVAAGQGERLFGPARAAIRETAFRTQARRAELVPAGLGDDVGLLGGLPLGRLARQEQAELEQGEMSRGRSALSRSARIGEHVGDKREQPGAAVVG